VAKSSCTAQFKIKSSPLGPKESDKAHGQRVLRIGDGASQPAVEERPIGPVVAVLQAAQQAFEHFVFAGDGELFYVLGSTGGETVAILEPFQAGSDRHFGCGLHVESTGDAIPFTG